MSFMGFLLRALDPSSALVNTEYILGTLRTLRVGWKPRLSPTTCDDFGEPDWNPANWSVMDGTSLGIYDMDEAVPHN